MENLQTEENITCMIDEKEIKKIAARFSVNSEIEKVSLYGSGNVNETYLVNYLVKDDRDRKRRFILQRLNSHVFSNPEDVSANMATISAHVADRLRQDKLPSEERWEIPSPLSVSEGVYIVRDSMGGAWRAMTFLQHAVSYDTVRDESHAREAGFALGRMHNLLHDLNPNNLQPVIPGFHDTPQYLKRFNNVVARQAISGSAEEQFSHRFIKDRCRKIGVLEDARQRGELMPRPIHGDPKISNIMLDMVSGKAIGMVDLDTVGPGLIQYDVGDLLRSCCNPVGEESETLIAVDFDLDRCRAIMTGYFSEAGSFLTKADLTFLYDGLRIITFELGLRFFTDHLEGDPYFRTNSRGRNLHRALVQFRLTECVEAKEVDIRAILSEKV